MIDLFNLVAISVDDHRVEAPDIFERHSWPAAPEQLAAQLEGCSRDGVGAITWRNAGKAFGYDGVERLARGNCTIAALREKTIGLDPTVPQVDAGRAPSPGTHAITYGETKERMATVMRVGA